MDYIQQHIWAQKAEEVLLEEDLMGITYMLLKPIWETNQYTIYLGLMLLDL